MCAIQILVAFFVIGCTKSKDLGIESVKSDVVIVHAGFAKKDTRVVLGESVEGIAKVLWTNGDSFTLAIDQSESLFSFTTSLEEDAAVADFNCSDENLPQLVEGMQVIATYPSKIPADFENQPGTKSKLGEYLMMEALATATSDSYSDLYLSFVHKTSVLKIVLTNDAFKHSLVESIKLSAEGLELNATSVFQGDEDGAVEVYFVIKDVMTLDKVEISAICDDVVYSASLGGKTLVAGKLYKATKIMADTGKREDKEELVVPEDKTQAIVFSDPLVKELCVLYWDLDFDDELSYEEAGKVKDIGTAFKGASITTFDELKYFTSLESIDNNAFNNCSKLTKITLPSAITFIGSNAFENCSSLTGFNIPSSVKTIGESVFKNCTAITCVEVPAGVSVLEKSVFYGCSNLSAVKLPDTITLIGDDAFRECTSLTSVYIPDGVTSIGSYAFRHCASVERVHIPKSVAKISSSFYDCTGELVVNCNIPDYAFWYAAFDKVIIGDNVTSIGESAFRFCSKITEVSGLSNVTSIGNEAFYECSKIPQISGLNNVTSIGDKAFYGCSKITEVSGLSKVTSIGNEAFYGCSSLQIIHLPNGITEIGKAAFADCRSLLNINLPESINKIGNGAFVNCAGELTVDCKVPSYAFENALFSKVVVGKNVSEIGYFAFNGCTSLTEVTMSDNVASIKPYAFYGCSSLSNFKMPTSVISVESGLFQDCISLQEVSLNNNITSIANSAFKNCSSLTNIILPENLTHLDWSAFENCSSLTVLSIPNTLTSIPDRAFYGCRSLTKVRIGHGVKTIGEYAFHNCSSLTTVNIPNDLTTIGRGAFANCSELKKLTIPSSVVSIDIGAFSGCAGEITINCNIPEPSEGNRGVFVDAHFSKVIIGDEVSNIGKYAFSNCKFLENVSLPANISSIGEYAFKGCTGELILNCKGTYRAFSESDFTKIVVCEGVDYLEDEAFANCSKVESVVIDDKNIWIASNAFTNCTGELIINCKKVGHGFQGSFFHTVTLGEEITSIYHSAFLNCSNLKTIYCRPLCPPEFSGFATDTLEAIYVPRDSYEAYLNDWTWSTLSSIIKPYDF